MAKAASACWIVKIGSALITDNGKGLSSAGMADWARQIAALKRLDVDVILISSGAVAAGMTRLAWASRPELLSELQAAAAVGQSGLVQAWEAAFSDHDIILAQVLLDHDDLSSRQRYLNARSTLKTLLSHNVVPIINENDTVVTDEIRFGDNDTLAALVANLVDADQLILLTDQAGLYTADPRFDAAAELIVEAKATDPRIVAVAGDSASGLGRGGMTTKVRAAKLAARSGTNTYIASGRDADVLLNFHRGVRSGTSILADQEPVLARKRWLAGQLKPKGSVSLDDGAVQSLTERGRSLLPVGVVATRGDYVRGDLIVCLDAAGNEIARGLVNYAFREVDSIKGLASHKVAEVLGYRAESELIHRDNMVLTV